MNQQDEINALKARLKEWEDAALEVVAHHISFENSIEMLTAENTELKAQVNCLRGYLKEISEYWNGDTNEIAMKDACYQALNVSQEALERIPEQCLAKVRAKAIEEYRQEQAEMKQMELATKLMVSSI